MLAASDANSIKVVVESSWTPALIAGSIGVLSLLLVIIQIIFAKTKFNRQKRTAIQFLLKDACEIFSRCSQYLRQSVKCEVSKSTLFNIPIESTIPIFSGFDITSEVTSAYYEIKETQAQVLHHLVQIDNCPPVFSEDSKIQILNWAFQRHEAKLTTLIAPQEILGIRTRRNNEEDTRILANGYRQMKFDDAAKFYNVKYKDIVKDMDIVIAFSRKWLAGEYMDSIEKKYNENKEESQEARKKIGYKDSNSESEQDKNQNTTGNNCSE